MHHLHADTLVITARVANSNVHRKLVDDGSAVDIIYLDAYKRMGLTDSKFNLTTSPLYEFMVYYIILRGTVKLALTMEEHPKVSTAVTEFLVVNCPSIVNGIIGKQLLKALKAAMSIYHLTMKFPTKEGIWQVRGSQYDSRECYNKSLKLAEKERNLPQKMEVEKVIMGPTENPCM